MNRTNLIPILLSVVLLAVSSCSKDDKVPADPADTVVLNMMNESNGATRLGVSDVFINKANNFSGRNSLIASAGPTGGLGVEVEPLLGNLVRETAVIPGYTYQVFDQEAVLSFPSGVTAISAGAGYYRLYVDAPIMAGNETVGASVKYTLVFPGTNGLPQDNHKIGEVSYSGQYISFELPDGAECFWYGGVPEVFNIFIDESENVLSLRLEKTPTETNGVSGNYYIYIRQGGVYSRVYVRVL